MKLGLIAPVAHLEELATGNFHLVLSHLINFDPDGSPANDYTRFYKTRGDSGDFITLDNSAYELGEAVSPSVLLDQAIKLNATELVVPDIIRSQPGTLRVAEEAVDYYRTKRQVLSGVGIQLMIVPQSTTIYGWNICMINLLEMIHSKLPEIRITLGIAKHTETWAGGRDNLIKRFVVPAMGNEKRFGQFSVHLLGMGEDMLQLSALAIAHPWIRSTDSVKPFVYAMHRQRLSLLHTETPTYLGRPPAYFDLTMNAEQIELAKWNSHVIGKRVGAV